MSSGPIRFACSSCGGNIRAPASQVGQTVQCPRCQATVTVPAEQEQEAPAADSVEQQPAAPKRPPRRRGVDAAPVDDRPLQIDDLGASDDEFSVTCPICGTRVSATPGQIGMAVSCPDCFSPVPILPRGARPQREPQTTRADDEFSLTAPVATPRYVPSAKGEVTADELYADSLKTADASNADDPDKSLEEFSISCGVCHTRLVTDTSQIGRTIRCPDCEHEITVRAPKKVSRAPVIADDEADSFNLSDLVQRPKYQSTTRGAVNRELLDQLDALHSTPPVPAESEAGKRSGGQIDFFVTCAICGSKVGAQDHQVGQVIRCSDCTSEVLVVAPRGKRASKTFIDDTDVAMEPEPPPLPAASARVTGGSTVPVVTPNVKSAPSPNVRSGNVVDAATMATLEKAEQEALERDAEVQLDKMPPFKQLFSVLADPGVLIRILWMSVIVLLQLWLITMLVGLSGLTMAALPVIVVFMTGLALPLLGYGCTATIAIVQCTAGGQVRIEEWNDDFFHDAFGSVLHVVVAISVSSLPGAVLCSLAISLGAPPAFAALLLPASLFLLFPFVLLSELEGGHPFHIFSWDVASSIRRAPSAWLRCYGETLILLLLTCGLTLISVSSNIFLRTLAAFGYLCVWALALRSIGILAFACNRALLERPQAAHPQQHPE